MFRGELSARAVQNLQRERAYFRIQPSVQEALMEGRPVVALESTIITHGMAYPQNLSMAREVEKIVMTNGAVPATIGILRGQIHVGLTDEELQFLASSKNVVKVSRRDLPYVLSQGLSGGTTVSGTMIAAHKAGICVFVTGGIGGVHRGGENTLDVSADLTELGRTPVAVVSAGVKSILDIGRTLEYLETQGVCVAAFGESREFPAFFSRQSGFKAPYHVQDEQEAAKLIASTMGLGLSSGVLIAVPCPQEQAASGQVIEEAIQQALGEARSKGITGKELTPFMLQKINELTNGKSLDSNCLSRLGLTPLFLSAVGKDEHSESVLHYCQHMDMSAILQLERKSTATYCAVITSAGELSVGLGDMDIHHQITEQYVSQFKEKLCRAPLVCIDGNVPLSTIQYVCQLAREHQLAELPSRLEDVIQTAMALARPLLAHLCCVVVTLGAHGVLLCGKSLGGSISLRPAAHEQPAAASLCATHYPAIHISREEIVNVSGAGDSLLAGLLAGMLAKHDTDTCVRMGLLAASLSLRSYEPISPAISTATVSWQQVQGKTWPEAKHSCHGIQRRPCQKPADCGGCLGLYTCKLPAGTCGLKAVSWQRGRRQRAHGTTRGLCGALRPQPAWLLSGVGSCAASRAAGGTRARCSRSHAARSEAGETVLQLRPTFPARVSF
ncbi:Pseudouridine-metabolizing bifunctional protein-like isoform X3 [Aix galericulata]|nr:Pseudouridine-metabolizing bifunctional protein-like isoform X3 [Aix galericulata]